MELLTQRENELEAIQKYSARGFLALYLVGALGYYGLRKGSLPVYKDVTMHVVLGAFGAFSVGYLSEKMASKLHYNQILIQQADKYNFTPEEVMDIQKNLNKQAIKRDYESDLNR